MDWFTRRLMNVIEGLDEVTRTDSGWSRILAWIIGILLVVGYAYRKLLAPWIQ